MNSFSEPPSTRRVIGEALAPLDRLVSKSPGLLTNGGARFERAGQTHELPRYLLIGPQGGDEPIRVGIFAGIHGDEPEGVHALVRFVSLLEREPDLARGFCLFLYPVCNPTGFEDGTRNARGGTDLNREFWRGSREPEVRLLESELTAHAFHGVISLHTDDTSHGFYGYAHGATLTRNLVEPALAAASEFVPVNHDEVIDGFRAQKGLIRDGFAGILRGPPGVRPRPFEVILETPQSPPAYLKEAALVAALRTVLARYREFIAFAPNL